VVQYLLYDSGSFLFVLPLKPILYGPRLPLPPFPIYPRRYVVSYYRILLMQLLHIALWYPWHMLLATTNWLVKFGSTSSSDVRCSLPVYPCHELGPCLTATNRDLRRVYEKNIISTTLSFLCWKPTFCHRKNMTLVNYSSSEDEGIPKTTTDTQTDRTVGIKRKREVQEPDDLPPLPSKFHSLYASAARVSTTDNPSLHGGRKRVTPHVEGSWPTHLYIECGFSVACSLYQEGFTDPSEGVP
jgi:hypothetical protein